MTEPKITVTNIDETIGLAADPIDNRANVLCPIISTSGPTGLTRITGPTEFRRQYFGNSAITPDNHMSAVFARALLGTSPVWVKRCCRHTLLGGISSASTTSVYVDTDLNVIESGILADIQPSGTETLEEAIEGLGLSTYIVEDDTKIYTTTAVSTSSSQWIKAVSTMTVKSYLTLTETLTSSVTVTIGDLKVTLPSGTSNLNDLLEALAAVDALPQYADASITSSDDLDNNTYTTLGWVSPITITLSSTSAGLSTSLSSTITVYYVEFKDEDEYLEEFELEDPYVYITLSDDTTWLYYCGSASTTADNVVLLSSNSTITYSEFMELLNRQSASDLSTATESSTTIVIPLGVDITGSDNLEISYESINEVIDGELFAIIARYPCSTDLYTVTVVADKTTDTYTITVSYETTSEEWAISFDATAVDGYGESLYYEKVNDGSELIYIVPLNGSQAYSFTAIFGAQVTSDYTSTEEMITCLEEIVENEEATVMFDYIVDGGVVNTELSQTINTLCEEFQSFYPASCTTTKSLSGTTSRRSSLSDDYRQIFIDECQRDTPVDSGMIIMPASYYYLKRRLELANTVQEFLPFFGPTNGYIGIDTPIKKWNKTQREDFLDDQIVTMKRSSTGDYYLNLNSTTYTTDSYLQEDQIVLMVNKINQVASQYAITLIGQNNTADLRATVTSYLNKTLEERLRVGTNNGPYSISVVCDTSNNPVSLQNQRKLRIDIYGQFYRSIKEVLIYTTIQSLSE